MPKSEAYLAGYGLYPGVQLAGFKLNTIHSGHEILTRYREYRYLTTMIWTSQGGDPNLLLNTLNQYLAAPRRILSEYGNPYECNFGPISLIQNKSSELIFGATGTCRRVY